jgi:hypothetical protein
MWFFSTLAPDMPNLGRNQASRRRLKLPHHERTTRLMVEQLEDRSLPSVLHLTPLVQVSGTSPFADSTADNIASQPGTVTLDSEAEPYLAVNPTNPKNAVGVWQQDLWTDKGSNGGARGIVAGVSLDGGNSWQEVPIPGITLVSGGTYQRTADAWLSFAPNGDLYEIAQADVVGVKPSGPDESAILVSKSIDGGLTWSTPITLIQDDSSSGFDDKPSVTADPTNANLVYAIWLRSNGTGANQTVTMFTRSTDGGQTWESPRTIFRSPQGDFNHGHVIFVRPDGTLIDLFTEFQYSGKNLQSAELTVLRSTDGGLTWSSPILVAEQMAVGDTDPESGQPLGDLSEGHYAMDPHDGNLYAVWEDARFGNGQYNSIAFTMSTDGGFTWSDPIRVNQTPDTVPAGNRQAFVPAVAVADNGTVAVTYYDLRNNTPAAGLPTDYWMVHADPSDGLANPASWQEENRLTDTSFNLEQAPRLFIGDYEGLAAAGKSFYATWAQPHDNDPDSIFFRDPPPAYFATSAAVPLHVWFADRMPRKDADFSTGPDQKGLDRVDPVARAEAMRRILIDNARHQKSDKAGGSRRWQELMDAEPAVET